MANDDYTRLAGIFIFASPNYYYYLLNQQTSKMKITPKNYFNIAITALACTIGISVSCFAQESKIKNDVFWNTKNGKPINSQGGGVFKFSDPKTGVKKYYWYGVNYEEATLYRNNPAITLPNATFESVTCYTSDDLVNWTFEADVLTKEETNKTGKTWVGRLGVAYVKELNKYAMVVQHGNKVLLPCPIRRQARLHGIRK